MTDDEQGPVVAESVDVQVFRKRPVEVQAVQLLPSEDGAHGKAVARWCGGYVLGSFDSPIVVIPTLEGPMRVSVGNWIIRGVEGEFYPCKSTIFAKTHTPVSPPVSDGDPMPTLGAEKTRRPI